jgi:hypothetical protein
MTRLAVELSFELFRRIFPVRSAAPSEPPLSDEERRRYRRWELGAIVPLFVICFPVGYLWYLALREAAGLIRQETPDTRFLLSVDPAIWALPAIALALITSAILLDGLYRALLRGSYRQYSRFCNERVGIDGERVFALMAAVVVAGSVVFCSVALRCFARFTENGVEIGRVLSLGSKYYEYKRVRGIEHRATFQAPNGNIIRRPHFVIVFDDGTSWSSDGPHESTPETASRIAQLVSRRSGRAITELP